MMKMTTLNIGRMISSANRKWTSAKLRSSRAPLQRLAHAAATEALNSAAHFSQNGHAEWVRVRAVDEQGEVGRDADRTAPAAWTQPEPAKNHQHRRNGQHQVGTEEPDERREGTADGDHVPRAQTEDKQNHNHNAEYDCAAEFALTNNNRRRHRGNFVVQLFLVTTPLHSRDDPTLVVRTYIRRELQEGHRPLPLRRRHARESRMQRALPQASASGRSSPKYHGKVSVTLQNDRIYVSATRAATSAM
jgi:hypothetical protein